MFHCHNNVHSDNGMMANFNITRLPTQALGYDALTTRLEDPMDARFRAKPYRGLPASASEITDSILPAFAKLNAYPDPVKLASDELKYWSSRKAPSAQDTGPVVLGGGMGPGMMGGMMNAETGEATSGSSVGTSKGSMNDMGGSGMGGGEGGASVDHVAHHGGTVEGGSAKSSSSLSPELSIGKTGMGAQSASTLTAILSGAQDGQMAGGTRGEHAQHHGGSGLNGPVAADNTIPKGQENNQMQPMGGMASSATAAAQEAVVTTTNMGMGGMGRMMGMTGMMGMKKIARMQGMRG